MGLFVRLFSELESPDDIKRFLGRLPVGTARAIRPDRLKRPTDSVEAQALRRQSARHWKEVEPASAFCAEHVVSLPR